MAELFKQRTLAIATMHGKEQVIRPILERGLQVNCILVPEINTDVLGTFSGEIERDKDPLETLRLKCELGFKLSGTNLLIANEGSFGRHPHLFFAQANQELIMLMDKQNDLEIVASHITTDTNFDGREVTDRQQVLEFAKKALFPSHGLIIKEHEHAKTCIGKGITRYEPLLELAEKQLRTIGKVWIETDMRALYNPTRMEAIREVTHQLVQKLQSECPCCSWPGFWISEVKEGLPCAQCGFATRSTSAHLYRCNRCLYEKEILFPYSRYYEDPMYCDVCNP